jgi:nucleolar protein 4
LHFRFRKWGILNYAVITMDRITGVSRGNGFVCFKSAEDAAKCLKDYEEAVKLAESMGFSSSFGNTGLITADHPPKSSLLPSLPESSQEATKAFMLDGRLVSVTLAVSKQVAEKISQASTLSRRATDKRHLYLMREGVVFPGSEASKELTSQELEHCTAQYANKKRLLATNPNLFISRTRLSIRGIPAKVTDQELRLKAKEAVKTFWNEVDGGNRDAMEPEVIEEELSEKRPPPGSGRKVVVKQAKIIKETDRLDATTKKPKSKGYGFIEFISHADALACLRVLNNQRNVFTSATLTAGTKTKRVVVEFAVENQLVLKKRQSRNSNTTGKEKSSKSSDQKAKRKAADMEVEGDGGKKKHKKSNDALSVEKKVSKFKERREKRAAKVLEKREGKENITPLPVPVSDKVKKSRTEKEKTKKRKPVLPGSAPDSFDLLLTQYSRKKLRS